MAPGAMHISYVQPLGHVEGMLVVYLPAERIVIEADLYDPPAVGTAPHPEPTAANRSLYRHARRLGFQVDTIVPIHGRPVPWSSFVSVVGADQ